MNALSLTYMVLTRALIASLYRIIGLASTLPLPNGIFGRPMRACPPEWKWLFATLHKYNVKHKHNQGKRVENGIACSKEGGNAMSPLHSQGSPNKGGQNQKSKPPLGITMMPLGAPSISNYGSLVPPDAQIVALRLRLPLRSYFSFVGGDSGEPRAKRQKPNDDPCEAVTTTPPRDDTTTISSSSSSSSSSATDEVEEVAGEPGEEVGPAGEEVGKDAAGKAVEDAAGQEIARANGEEAADVGLEAGKAAKEVGEAGEGVRDAAAVEVVEDATGEATVRAAREADVGLGAAAEVVGDHAGHPSVSPHTVGAQLVDLVLAVHCFQQLEEGLQGRVAWGTWPTKRAKRFGASLRACSTMWSTLGGNKTGSCMSMMLSTCETVRPFVRPFMPPKMHCGC